MIKIPIQRKKFKKLEDKRVQKILNMSTSKISYIKAVILDK